MDSFISGNTCYEWFYMMGYIEDKLQNIFYKIRWIIRIPFFDLRALLTPFWSLISSLALSQGKIICWWCTHVMNLLINHGYIVFSNIMKLWLVKFGQKMIILWAFQNKVDFPLNKTCNVLSRTRYSWEHNNFEMYTHKCACIIYRTPLIQ